MSSARPLKQRLRNAAPEAATFAVIGAGNTVMYLAIMWWIMSIGAVKATIVATVVTTTLAYLATRWWTYRQHTRNTVRREYTLFFGFNLAGMVIQSAIVAVGKYGFGLTEERDRVVFLVLTAGGIAAAAVFRFWAYRTFVFGKPTTARAAGVPVPAPRASAPHGFDPVSPTSAYTGTTERS